MIGIILSGCSLLPQKAGIEIMSYPTAKVIIDGKDAGMTPYRNNSMKPGSAEIKLSTNEVSWTKKIELINGVNTVIDREIGKTEKENSGYLLTLESTGDKNKTGLMINAIPDKATVSINGEILGRTPLRIEEIGEGEKQVSISLPRHKTIIVLVRAIRGYQVVIEADLKEEIPVNIERKTDEEISSQPSSNLIKRTIKIKETETGWLRVRGQPNGQSAEIGRVNPGVVYEVLDERDGYYEIEIGSEKTGWILAKYAEIL